MKTNKLTIDELAKLLDLPPWDDIQENNWELVADAGQAAYNEESAEDCCPGCDCECSPDREERAEAAKESAEHAAQDELYAQWYDGIESAANTLLEAHGLSLVPRYKKTSRKYQGTPDRPYDLEIVPAAPGKGGWILAAIQISTTMSAVGDGPGNYREFLASGPYTPRQAVLEHIGYITSYPEVYGSSSAQSIYERSWR